ncbi:MAG: hypothetical protein KDA93_09175 [Planctomycetaceae bacterium]|nr:hypothetical protein [Planctomycetaceae bacterium]
MKIQRRFLTVCLVIAIASIAMMPVLMSSEDPVLSERRQAIELMSTAERQRLERNFTQFQQMTEAEREQYRQLHAELAEDAANNHGRANEALLTYRNWLQTLSPSKRIEISEESDSAGKVRLIREVIEQRQDEELELRAGEALGRLGSIPSLKPEDMERVLTIIGEAIEPEIPVDELEGFEGLSRTLKMFEVMGRRREKLVVLLTEERLQAIKSALTNDSDRRMLEYLADNRPAPPQLASIKLTVTLIKNLEVAARRGLRKEQVTPEKLQTYFDSLSLSEQDELLELSASQFRAELRRQYADENGFDRINRRDVEQFLRPGPENRLRGRGKPGPPRSRPGDQG